MLRTGVSKELVGLAAESDDPLPKPKISMAAAMFILVAQNYIVLSHVTLNERCLTGTQMLSYGLSLYVAYMHVYMY